MQIAVNGEKREIEAGMTVAQLLKHYDLAPLRVAIEINCELVRRARFDETHLSEGDQVEIVTLVGGG